MTQAVIDFEKRQNGAEVGYEKILDVALFLAWKKDIYTRVGMNRYLKHPTVDELVDAFFDHNLYVGNLQIEAYMSQLLDEKKIMHVTREIGFVYTQLKEVV